MVALNSATVHADWLGLHLDYRSVESGGYMEIQSFENLLVRII